MSYVYLCHECGSVLQAIGGSSMMFCDRCKKHRRVPTDPHLIRPYGSHVSSNV